MVQDREVPVADEGWEWAPVDRVVSFLEAPVKGRALVANKVDQVKVDQAKVVRVKKADLLATLKPVIDPAKAVPRAAKVDQMVSAVDLEVAWEWAALAGAVQSLIRSPE